MRINGGAFVSPTPSSVLGVTVGGTAASGKAIVASAAAAAAWTPVMALQASTPLAGTALTAGTPTLLSWTAPNDGQPHSFQVACALSVTAPTTGGQISVNFTTGGSAKSFVLFNATKGSIAVDYGSDNPAFGPYPCDPNTTVTVTQSTGLTGGAAVLIGQLQGC